MTSFMIIGVAIHRPYRLFLRSPTEYFPLEARRLLEISDVAEIFKEEHGSFKRVSSKCRYTTSDNYIGNYQGQLDDFLKDFEKGNLEKIFYTKEDAEAMAENIANEALADYFGK